MSDAWVIILIAFLIPLLGVGLSQGVGSHSASLEAMGFEADLTKARTEYLLESLGSMRSLPESASVSDEFAAFCACPKCGTIACHPWRDPEPLDPQVVTDWESGHDIHQVKHWAGHVLATRFSPPKPIDEMQYRVIRQCACGREWGQA